MISGLIKTYQLRAAERLRMVFNKRMLNVCIVGSGVAGLSTARRLIKVGRCH